MLRSRSATSADRPRISATSASAGQLARRAGTIAEAEEARGRELRRFVEAARPLFTSLTEAQKRRIPVFLGMTEHGGLGQPSAALWLFEEEEGGGSPRWEAELEDLGSLLKRSGRAR